MAPPKWRGRLNTLVQCGTITGIVVGSGINIGANVSPQLSDCALQADLIGCHAACCSDARNSGSLYLPSASHNVWC